jgi:nucleotide-binding universal stress UspA family protein
MKHILIPVDFTDPSWKVARYALARYQKPGMRFYLMHSEYSNLKARSNESSLEHKEHDGVAWSHHLEEFLAPHQKMIALQWKGSLIENIKDAVFDYDIDLIILDTGHAYNLDEPVGVNLIKDIITRVKCPVFIVPRAFKCHQPQQIVLVSDFNFTHRARATNTLSQFMQSTQAHLNILQLSKTSHALTPAQLINKSFLQNALEHVSHSFHFVIDTSMNEALQFFINIHDVDLVILFAKHINLSENLLFLPVHRDHIDYRTKVPFLIIHE